MQRSDLCDYGGSYIVVRRIEGTNSNNRADKT